MNYLWLKQEILCTIVKAFFFSFSLNFALKLHSQDENLFLTGDAIWISLNVFQENWIEWKDTQLTFIVPSIR